MLEIELGGKRVATTEDKQILTINGNPIEVERIGNAIYVNKSAINLIIPEAAAGKKTNWTGILLVAGGITAFALAATNFEAVLGMATGAVDFATPYVNDLMGTVGGYVDGSGTSSQ